MFPLNMAVGVGTGHALWLAETVSLANQLPPPNSIVAHDSKDGENRAEKCLKSGEKMCERQLALPKGRKPLSNISPRHKSIKAKLGSESHEVISPQMLQAAGSMWGQNLSLGRAGHPASWSCLLVLLFLAVLSLLSSDPQQYCLYPFPLHTIPSRFPQQLAAWEHEVQ